MILFMCRWLLWGYVWLYVTDYVFIHWQGEKISTILKAANVEVEPYWPGLFAKALEGINVKDLITNIGSGVGAAPAAAPAAAGAAPAAAAAEKKEEKKEESEEEEDDDMGFGEYSIGCVQLRQMHLQANEVKDWIVRRKHLVIYIQVLLPSSTPISFSTCQFET